MTGKLSFALGSALVLAGCATMETPRNAAGSIYASQQGKDSQTAAAVQCHAAAIPAAIQNLTYVAPSAIAEQPDMLSDGDRLRLTVAGDTDQLTGNYVIAGDGSIMLMGRLRVRAAGMSVAALEQRIAATLANEGLVRPLTNGVRLQLVELGGVAVSVAGAVFEPGQVKVGDRQAEVRNLNLSNVVSGDMNGSRMLSTALRAAGGVRPDADATAIYLVRGQAWTRLNMRGALDGGNYDDLGVTSGDQVIVQTKGCLDGALVRPSPITAPGIRIYMSNLSRPAASNASSAIGKETTSLPYGTRFSQALVSGNCVGGSAMNAARSAVLMSRNPITGQSVVISRSVEKMMRSADRDASDPYLLPGDAIACYDSMAMNLRDVVSVVSETLTPYALMTSVAKK